MYGADGKYAPVFRCQVCASPETVRTREHSFDVFCYIAEEFHDRLKAEGYAPDPVVREIHRNIDRFIAGSSKHRTHNHQTKRQQYAATMGRSVPFQRRTPIQVVRIGDRAVGWAAYWAVAVTVVSEVFWDFFPGFLLADFFDAAFFATVGFD